MSSSREEIVARMSMDVSQVERALTGLRGRLASLGTPASPGGFLSGFMHSLESAHGGIEKFVSAFGHQFGALLTVGGLVQLGHSVLEFADKLKFQSDELGVSVEFLQDYQFAAQQTGVGSEKATKALEIFTRKIGQARAAGKESISVGGTLIPLDDAAGNAKPTEQLFLETADAIKNIEDPTLRAAAAFERFGKGGVGMIAMLRDGSEGFREFGHNLTKLSTEDVQALDDFGDKLTSIWTRIKVTSGKLLTGSLLGDPIVNLLKPAVAMLAAVNQARAKGLDFTDPAVLRGVIDDANAKLDLVNAKKKAGPISPIESSEESEKKLAKDAELQAKIDKVIEESQTKQLTGKAKLQELTNQRIDLESELRDIMDAGIDRNLGPQERELEVRKELLGINLGIKTVNDDIAAAMLKQEAARAAVEDARLALSAAKEDRSKFTLEELATSRIGFTGRLGQEQILARQAAFLEKRAEIERKLGFGDASQRDFTAADAIRNLLPDLKSTEKDRFKVLEKNLAKQVDTLNVLLNREATDGLHIALVNSN
jgi:hypothetical protein